MKPIEIFGEETPELYTFYESLDAVAPGAVEVMEQLMNAWQPYAMDHSWTLPDGFEAYVPVMEAVDFKVEVDELDHSTFTHRVYENQGTKEGLSISANITHSIDALVVREMNRRCNYDESLHTARGYLDMYLKGHDNGDQADYSSFTSLRLATQLTDHELHASELGTGQCKALMTIIDKTLAHKSFPIICVHDESKLGSAIQ